MTKEPEAAGSERTKILFNILLRLRDREVARIRELRSDQAGETLSEPRDTLEDARASEDFDLHADLIARAEDRLAKIHAAFDRLDEGKFGSCEKCGRQIDLARIRALPFAELCAACEGAHPHSKTEGITSDEFMHRWSVPEGTTKSLGVEEPLELPEANPSALAGETFVPAPVRAPARQKAPHPRPRRKRGR